MKRTVSKWLSILSCTALLCTSIPAAFAEGTVEESLVPVTGAQPGFVLSQGKYYTDFANLAQERAAAKALNIQLGEEGFVLLKNDGVLPLDSATTKVSMFGFRAANIMMGGGGSGSGRPGQYGVPKTTLEDGMKQAGFDVNERLLSFYSTKSAEVKPTDIPDSITYTYDAYSDAALVVVSRSGSEGRDEVTYGYAQDENADPNAHMLELTDTEKDLIRYVKANFPKVILIVNSSNAMELAEVNAPKTEDNLGVDAILWVGHTGNDGAAAIGNILSGKASPSGRTADTYAVDFTKDPTFTNFGSNGQNFENGERMNNNVYVGDTMTDYHSVEYREGIYVGYRYYETKGHDAGEAWYDENVVYPFGYGLSYTTFDWEVQPLTDTVIAQDAPFDVNVKVTNTGSVAGKEVVEVYASAPYFDGGIEKAHKVLVGFAKTELLKPGASETVTVTVDPYTMASYDYRDANDNGFCGYELEAGDYTLYVGRNAHQEEAALGMTVEDDIRWETDPITDNKVTNLYTDGDFLDSDWQLDTVLSRSDWEGTWPTAQTAETHKGSDQLYEELKDTEHNNPTDFDSEEYPWFDEETDLTLRSLLPETTPDKTYSAIVDYDDPLWDEILDACNDEEMISLVNNGAYHTLAMETIDLPTTIHGDGPAGFTCFMNQNQVNGTCQYVSEPVMASTWNVELMEEMGEALGDEGLMGDRATGQPYSSIYAPGANIHRSPFGGRCSEYFSEDPFITGMMSAYEVRGMQSKGVIPTVKHFAANEQETHRSINGDSSWLTEQALREIYLKGFEIAVKTGEARGVMSSFNRIGTRWTGGDYRLITQILRNEWGFKGFVICDFNTIPQYMIPRQMFYAGGDLDLATLESSMWTDCDSSDNGDAIVLRNATKNLVYALVNSNAMNAKVIGYDEPLWHSYLLYVNVGLGCIMGIWGVLAFVHAFKLKKKLKEQK